MLLLLSPSNSHRFGCAVTGYQGDESGDMGVLQRGEDTKDTERCKRENIKSKMKRLLNTDKDSCVCKTHPYDDTDS